VTATLSATQNLVTATILNCGSMFLTPGTYMISCFCYIDVINGTTTVNGLSSAYSTSPTAYSHGVDATLTGEGAAFPGNAWSLNSTDCVVVVVRCVLIFAARLRFVTTFSKFSAVRIA